MFTHTGGGRVDPPTRRTTTTTRTPTAAPQAAPGAAPFTRVTGLWPAYNVQTRTNPLVNGMYSRAGTHHGRGVFKTGRRRDMPARALSFSAQDSQEASRGSTEGSAQVMVLYYSDAGDGEDQRGWWIGTEVGGSQVHPFFTKFY